MNNLSKKTVIVICVLVIIFAIVRSQNIAVSQKTLGSKNVTFTDFSTTENRSQLATALASFTDLFTNAKTIEEAGEISESSSTDWWVNSGGYFYVENGLSKTVQGDLVSSDKWRTLYAKENNIDTDNGYHPQNIFRLVTKSMWQNYQQEVYFTINKQNLSTSPERNAWSGLLLFNRYQDGDNLYYTGIRADGTAVIKSKKKGVYTTLTQVPIFPGTYNRETNPTLLPQNTPIGLRSTVETLPDGSVSIKLFMDNGKTGVWTQIATALDTANPVLGSHSVGMRTDFMDVTFQDYKVEENPTVDTVLPTIPSGLKTLSKTDSQIALSWLPASDNVGVVGYDIYKDGVKMDSTRTSTSYTARDLSANTSYSFTVRARDLAVNASEQSAPLKETTGTVAVVVDPPPIIIITPVLSNVTVGGITETGAKITWTTNIPTDGLVQYGISSVYGNASPLSTTLATTHEINLTNLTPTTTYHYTVISKDASGASVPSPDAVFSTLTPIVVAPPLKDITPPTPVSLSTLFKRSDYLGLSWTKASDDTGVVGYTIYNNGIYLDSTRTSTSVSIRRKAGVTYTLTVRARDAAGNLSFPSNTLVIQP